MNTTIIIVGMLLAFVTGFFCALKSLQIGLKFKAQIENKESPTIDNPIVEIKKANEEIKISREEQERQEFMKRQFNEYFYGAGGE